MIDPGLEQMAAQLRRPVGSLAAFASLTPEQLSFLNRAIDEAIRRDREAMGAVPEGALPAPLRRALLWLLGWRTT